MVLKYTSKDGKLRIHGPPYSKTEEDEFYRRNARGPVTVYRSANDRKAPTSTQESENQKKL